jgi:excinuclease ABC subunit B
VPAVADEERVKYIPREEIPPLMATLEKQMKQAAKKLEFEKAAELRDQIRDLQRRMLGIIDQ